MVNPTSGGAPLPPPVDLRVFRLAKGEAIHVRSLSAPSARNREPLLGYLTHWHQGRSKVCRGPGQCDPSVHKVDPIWYGFLPFERWDEQLGFWVSIVLQITESLELDFRGRLERGQTWTIARPAIKRSGCPVRGEFTGNVDLATLPEPFGVMKTLQVLFHWPELALPKVANPTPAREGFTPSRGMPPPGSKAFEELHEQSDRLSPQQTQEVLKKLRERSGNAVPNENGKH